MDKQFEKDLKQFIEDLGYSNCKKAGLGATMKAFYLGTGLDTYGSDFDEVANELELSRKESNYWEDLWYKKDSWFNQLG